MSVKIYEAWRFKGGLNKLLPLLHEFHKAVIPEQKAVLGRNIAHQLARKIDAGQPHEDFFYEALRSHMKTDDGDPVSWNVSCFPTGRSVLILFYGPRWIREAFEKHFAFEEFGYWNSSDKPEEVTDAQWAYRKKAWEKVLTGSELSGVPADLGYTYKPHFPWGAVFEKHVLENQPSLEDRAADLLLDLMFAEDPEAKKDPFRRVGQIDNQIREAREGKDPLLWSRLQKIASSLQPLTSEDL